MPTCTSSLPAPHARKTHATHNTRTFVPSARCHATRACCCGIAIHVADLDYTLVLVLAIALDAKAPLSRTSAVAHRPVTTTNATAVFCCRAATNSFAVLPDDTVVLAVNGLARRVLTRAGMRALGS